MRVGLFFGSFNPIHNGHIRIARSVLERAVCDEVWLVVSPQNPFKAGVDMLSERERFSLVEQALLTEPQIKACDVELDMPKPSYTIDTLNELERMYPNVEFAIIMGGDNMAKFDKIAVLHSGLSDGEKYDEWRKIKEGKVNIVIGARSAIFAPLENIGIIISQG